MTSFDLSTKYTRCYCFHEGQRPIKTEFLLGQWIPIENEANRLEILKVLPCGHAVHERCSKLMNRICFDLKKNMLCPVCDPDWTRPLDFQQRMGREKGFSHIQFNPCICSEVDNIRTVKGTERWNSFDLNVFIYPCGHGFHNKCLIVLNKTLEKPTEALKCPLCERNWNPEKRIDDVQQKVVHDQLELVQNELQTSQKDMRDYAIEWKKHTTMIIIGTLFGTLFLLENTKKLITNQTKLPWVKTTVGDISILFLAILVMIIQAKVWGMWAPPNKR